MTDVQGSPRTTARHADDGGRGLPCILVIGEAALATNFMTQLIFKHLERNLAPQMFRVQDLELYLLRVRVRDLARLEIGFSGRDQVHLKFYVIQRC